LVAASAIAWILIACAGVQPAPRAAKKLTHLTPAPTTQYLDPRAPTDLSNLRFVGMDDGPVPDFSLESVQGGHYDSKQLVGERAFLVFFFATWCPACELKLLILRSVLATVGPVTVIAVSMDGPETWPKVHQYLHSHGLDVPLVRASQHLRFTLSYNPFETVPLVVVVGKNGGLVDYQLGYEPGDETRLMASLRLAQRIAPLAGSGPRGAPEDGSSPPPNR
jgi:peroxiredoxin